MDTPGKLLKAEREKQQKSLEELANALRIRQDFLEAVENGNYGIIPGEVFVKGYIRAYADYLGLNSDYILKLYRKQTAKTAPVESKADIANKRKFPVYKAVLIFAGSILIAVFLFIFINHKDEEPVGQSVAEPVVEQPEVIEEPKIIPEEKQEEITLEITATEPTWILVAADGGSPAERMLYPGDTVSLKAAETFSVKIGNAAGVKLVFNGRSMDNLGSRGEVITLVLPEKENAREDEGQN